MDILRIDRLNSSPKKAKKLEFSSELSGSWLLKKFYSGDDGDLQTALAWELSQNNVDLLLKNVEFPSTSKASTNQGDRVPAGMTYFGQLVAHDLVGVTQDGRPTNVRKPYYEDGFEKGKTVSSKLELETVLPKCFDEAFELGLVCELGFVRTKHIGSSCIDHYRPSALNGSPVLNDQRNAENRIISQLVLVFYRLYNYVLNKVICKKPNLGAVDAYLEARSFVMLVYQKLVLKDYSSSILSGEAKEFIDVNFDKDAQILFRYINKGQVPTEFSAAFFRFGHSMILKNYVLNPIVGSVDFVCELLGDKSELPKKHVIEWSKFFWSEGECPDVDANFAGLLDFQIVVAKRVSDLKSSNIAIKKNHKHKDSHTTAMANMVNSDLNASQYLPSVGAILKLLSGFESDVNLKKILKKIGICNLQGYIEKMEEVVKGVTFLSDVGLDNIPLALYPYIEVEALYSTLNHRDRLGPISSLIVYGVLYAKTAQSEVNILDKANLSRALENSYDYFCDIEKLSFAEIINLVEEKSMKQKWFVENAWATNNNYVNEVPGLEDYHPNRKVTFSTKRVGKDGLRFKKVQGGKRRFRKILKGLQFKRKEDANGKVFYEAEADINARRNTIRTSKDGVTYDYVLQKAILEHVDYDQRLDEHIYEDHLCWTQSVVMPIDAQTLFPEGILKYIDNLADTEVHLSLVNKISRRSSWRWRG